MIQYKSHQSQIGFALLLTLVVVSVVLAIGLSLLDITIKQLVLSGTGRDSEIAFQAAYAGRDCGNYWAKEKRDTIIDGSDWNLGLCIGTVSNPVRTTPAGLTGNVYKTSYEITWGAVGEERCTEIDIYIYDASDPAAYPVPGPPLVYDIASYGSGSEWCGAGNICNLVFSRGYNRACTETADIRTIQREIVSQF